MPATSQLVDIFRDTLDLPAEVDVKTLAYRQVREWDSVGHMQLVAALESEFDIMFDTQDILDMSSFEKAIEILGKYDVVITD